MLLEKTLCALSPSNNILRIKTAVVDRLIAFLFDFFSEVDQYNAGVCGWIPTHVLKNVPTELKHALGLTVYHIDLIILCNNNISNNTLIISCNLQYYK